MRENQRNRVVRALGYMKRRAAAARTRTRDFVRWHGAGALVMEPGRAWPFIALDRESTNYTYDIANRAELVDFVSETLGVSSAQVTACIAELEHDDELRDELKTLLARRRDRNSAPRYGRRLGWYAIVRISRPEVVIETGTHDGLGAAVLARALQRNAAEGHPGLLYTFDIDSTSGWLVPVLVKDQVNFVRGDSALTLPQTLARLPSRVGFFLHDSDHSFEHEMREIELVEPFLAPGGMMLSDNAHVTTCLADWARLRGFPYAFWKEVPLAHPYPGGGLGVAGPTLAAASQTKE